MRFFRPNVQFFTKKFTWQCSATCWNNRVQQSTLLPKFPAHCSERCFLS